MTAPPERASGPAARRPLLAAFAALAPPVAVFVALLAAPLALLGPCLLGPRTFVPYDLAQFPPASTRLSAAELAEVRAGQNSDVTEIQVTFLPELRFAAQELRAGRLPEWNPYSRAGVPLLATSVAGLLYPPNWPLLLARHDPADGLAWSAWASLVLGELSLFGFLRALGLGRGAALFGAVAFAFSGTTYANAYYYMRLPPLMWLPGMLWATLAASRRSGRARLLPLAVLAACVAMGWLAGFPPYAGAATLVAGAYGGACAFACLRREGPRAALSLAGGVLAALAVGLALAAVQLVPMLEFFPESNRDVAPGLAELAEQALDPAALLGYLLPDAFGHPSAPELPYDHSPLALWLSGKSGWDGLPLVPPGYNFVEYTVFPGALTLLLALAGILGRGPLRAFAAAGWIALLTLAIGPRWLGGLYELPGLRNVPPMRFAGPACMLVACLAALGLQRLREPRFRARWWGLAALAALVAAACAAARYWLAARSGGELLEAIRPAVLSRARLVLPSAGPAEVDAWIAPFMDAARGRLIANLDCAALGMLGSAGWLAGAALLRAPLARHVLAALAVVATLATQAALARGVCGGRELRHPVDTEVHRFLRERRDAAREDGGITVARGSGGPTPALATQLPGGTLVPDRIRDLHSYTFVDKRSHLPFLAAFGPEQLVRSYWIDALPDDARLASRFLDLLGVRYVLAAGTMRCAGSQVGPALDGSGGSFRVYERPRALPRAFTVPSVRIVEAGGGAGVDAGAREDRALAAALVAPEFDPTAEVLLTPTEAARLAVRPARDPRTGPATRPDARGGGGAQRAVRFERDDPCDVELRVGDGERAYLVVADTCLPGWSVTVNGSAVPLLAGDLFLRVVEIPEGPAHVRFRYRTPGLAAGAALSALAALVLAAAVLAGVRGARAAREAAR